MKIGFFGFNNGALGHPDAMARALRAMDDAGFESAWTGEHVVVVDPQEPPSPVPPGFPMVDTVAALSFAAGVTEKIRLGSGIILLAQRNPVVLAKELTGIDHLSKGRLLFGVGVGYVPREFEVIGVPYEERGARVSEHIEAIRALWTQDQPEFSGQFTQISGIQQKPMPVQQPHPPIIIGGMSPVAYRRAVRQGNGWYGFAQTLEATAASVQGLKEAASVETRPSELGELEISVTPPPGAVDADTAKRYEDLGVSRLTLLPGRLDDKGTPGEGAVRFVESVAQEFDL
ncbi:MAG: LLM class F420-dependent oxidoreductase [Gammaproteobacteria bacterium]|nr:LLM class F420-dependent oxidoreductase [Gammaproteobacteria bacterium]